MSQHVMCKCRHYHPKSVIGYKLWDKDPNGPGFLDLDCDYQLMFRFYEYPSTEVCLVWAGDQSKNSQRDYILPRISVELEGCFVDRLVQEGKLHFSEDQEEAQVERENLCVRMFHSRTCTRRKWTKLILPAVFFNSWKDLYSSYA